MRGSLTLLLLVLSTTTLLPVSPVVGQVTGSSDALSRYNAEKKDELAAIMLEMAIPIVGHAYVDDAKVGLKPTVVSVGGLVLAIAGTSVGCRQQFLGSCIQDGNDALIIGGVLAYLGGRVWGVVSAMDYARRHNEELRQRLNLAIEPNVEGFQAKVSIQVGM